MKLTAQQRKALTAARDHGNAWHITGQVWRASTSSMIGRLFAAGLLTRDGKITDAGRALVTA